MKLISYPLTLLKMVIPVAAALILAKKLNQLTEENQYRFNVDSLLETLDSDERKIDRKIATQENYNFQKLHQAYYNSRDL